MNKMIAPNNVDAYHQGYNDGYKQGKKDALKDLRKQGKENE